jgi:hypothetical protein
MLGSQWFTPIILATQETDIRRILVRSQSRQIIHETLSQKYPVPRTGGVAQGVGPEFKSQYRKKKKKKEKGSYEQTVQLLLPVNSMSFMSQIR